MAGLLMEACSPSLRSSYSHLSHQLDWHQQGAGVSKVSIPSPQSPVKDFRTAFECQVQVPQFTFSGHDNRFTFRAKRQLLLPKDPSSLVSTLEEAKSNHSVDDLEMGGSSKRQKKQEDVRKQDDSKVESSRAHIASAHSTTTTSNVSPTISTSPQEMEPPQLTVTGAMSQKNEELPEEEGGEEISGSQSDDEEDVPKDLSTMTAAERLAEKRKMKRFRLTHSQTRFLNSEFARQPHPDAAQRERLSSEIPGLSPRQVQVWFQNRRAKMKRLSGDDQERMMRSRALPAGFNIAQGLRPSGSEQPNRPERAQFGAPSSNYASPSTSPFPRSGETFPRILNPANLGYQTQGNLRARSGSLMSLTASSPSAGGSPLVHPRSSLSAENLQAAYQPQYDESSRNRMMYLNEMSNLSMQSPSLSGSPHAHPGAAVSSETAQAMYQTQYSMPSPFLLSPPDYGQTPTTLRRDSTSSRSNTMPVSSAPQSYSQLSFPMPSPDHLPSPTYQYHTPQIQRRQTQPSYSNPQQRPTGMASLAPIHAPQPSEQGSAMYQMAGYALSPQAQFAGSPTFPAPQRSPTSAQVSPTGTFQLGQQQQQAPPEENEWDGMYIGPGSGHN